MTSAVVEVYCFIDFSAPWIPILLPYCFLSLYSFTISTFGKIVVCRIYPFYYSLYHCNRPYMTRDIILM